MGWFTKLRDAIESIAVVAGNYVLPGSSLITSNLVTKGAQKNLGSDLGKVALVGSGLAGAGVGSEYTGIPASSGVSTLSDMFSGMTGGEAGGGGGGAGPMSSVDNVATTDLGTSNAGYDSTSLGASTAPTPDPLLTQATVSQGSNIPAYGTAGGEGNYGYDMGTGTGVSGTVANPYANESLAETTRLAGQNANATGTPTATPSFLEAMSSGNFSDAAGSAGNWLMKNPKEAMYIGGSLYDMYAKNQMAKKQDALYQQNRADIMNTYAPGSAEYNLLKQEMERKDAAAGRNSQYGTRANEFAGNIARFRTNALSNLQNSQNTLANLSMGNRYGMMNTPLTLAALTATQRG